MPSNSSFQLGKASFQPDGSRRMLINCSVLTTADDMHSVMTHSKTHAKAPSNNNAVKRQNLFIDGDVGGGAPSSYCDDQYSSMQSASQHLLTSHLMLPNNHSSCGLGRDHEQHSNLTTTQLPDESGKMNANGQKFRHVSQPSMLSFYHHDSGLGNEQEIFDDMEDAAGHHPHSSSSNSARISLLSDNFADEVDCMEQSPHNLAKSLHKKQVGQFAQ